MINIVAILMMSAKVATLGLLKIEIFSSKGYCVIIYVHDVTNKILLRVSNYIEDVVKWPKFGNTSISMTEVIITWILYKDLTRKNTSFEGCSRFKFNNLVLLLGMVLKLYVSVTNVLKLNVRKFNSYVCRRYKGKTGRSTFSSLHLDSWIRLNCTISFESHMTIMRV